MKSEIIAVGSEMLTPWRQDTNSLYLTEKLNEIGVSVNFKTIVGDRRKDLVSAIRAALARTDILILMGGLGPTEDDLTREAAAEALSIGLRRDNDQLAALHTRAAAMRFSMPENNLKQADVLQGADVLPNANGSAPGQWLDVPFAGFRKLIMLLPGPPAECKPLFDSACLPRLRAVVPMRHIAKRTLRAAMIAESQADKLLAPIYTPYKDVETTILAHGGDIQLTLLCSKANAAQAQQRVDELAGRMEEALEDWLYSSGGEASDSLEQIVLYYLGLRQATLAVAESCTGGMVAQRITAVPGSSRSFLGAGADRAARGSQRAGSGSAGFRDSFPDGGYAGAGNNRDCRAYRRNREQARGAGVHRGERRAEDRVHREDLPGQPGKGAAVRLAAGAGYGAKKASVGLLSSRWLPNQ